MSLFVVYLIPFSAGIAWLFSLTSFAQRPVPLYLRLFSIYLLFDCTVNIFAEYQSNHNENNLLLSSLSSVVSFCFFIYVVRGFIQRRQARRVFLYFIYIIPPAFAIDIFLLQKSQGVFQSITYSLGCFFVVAACIYYFWELFQHTHYVKLVAEPAFWICSGVLFYFVCTFPIYSLINFMPTVDPGIIKVLVIILDSVNILLYLSFIIAFLCRLNLKNSTSLL